MTVSKIIIIKRSERKGKNEGETIPLQRQNENLEFPLMATWSFQINQKTPKTLCFHISGLGRREKPAWNSQKCKSFIWEKMNQSPIIDDNPVSNSPTKPAVQSWTPSVSQEDSISRLVCRSSIETARHQRGPILPNEPDSVQRARWKSSCPSQRGISSRTRSESPTPVLGLKQVNLGEKNPENSRWKSHKWTAIDKNERRSSRWG